MATILPVCFVMRFLVLRRGERFRLLHAESSTPNLGKSFCNFTNDFKRKFFQLKRFEETAGTVSNQI
jgi:hypothetical protein